MKNGLILMAALLALTACAQPPGAPAEAAPSGTFTLWQLPNQTTTQIMSYVLKTAHGKVIVIDGGMGGDAPYLTEFLNGLGGNIEAWFITHPHDDHFNALIEILKQPGTLTIGPIYGSLPEAAWIDNGAMTAKRRASMCSWKH